MKHYLLPFFTLSPYIIFAHRQAQLENFLTPIYLLAFILLLDLIKNQKKTTLSYLFLICLTAGFVKLIGLILPVIICFWLIKEKRYKASALITLSLFISIAILLFYYAKVDLIQFIHILQLQTQQERDVYLGSLWGIISKPEFYQPFRDGWYFLGFLSFFIFGFSGKTFKHKFITLNTTFILLSILFTAGLNNNFPWYRYPLLPFISMTSGWFIWDLLKRPRIATFILFVFLMLGNVEILVKNDANLRSLLPMKTILILLLTPSLLYEVWQKEFLKKTINFCIILILLTSIAINALIVLNYPNSRCADVQCAIPLKIMVSES